MSEPTSPNEGDHDVEEDFGPSALSSLLRKSPPQSVKPDAPISADQHHSEFHRTERKSAREETRPRITRPALPATEQTPLLSPTSDEADALGDIEGQKTTRSKRWFSGFVHRGQNVKTHLVRPLKVVVTSPRRWNRKTIWDTAVIEPVSCLPAVAVGLLLNILDALSYGRKRWPCHTLSAAVTDLFAGMIMFPLGKELFSQLGSAGISIFYVSTIISQITFSTGSIFRGAVGSELVRRGQHKGSLRRS